MKNIKYQFVAMLTAGMMLFATSCDDFLEIPPVGSLSEAQLTTLAGLDAVLLSVYSQVNGRNQRMASPSNWVWGSIRGAEANKGTDPGDFGTINPIQRFETDPTNVNLQENWQGNFEGIARANQVLRLLDKRGPDVSDAAALGIEAQARFLKAHYYFQLWRNFNKVPIIPKEADYKAGLEEIKNDQEMLPYIEAEMRFAADNLPATQPQIGRVNSWAAKSYLGKILLYKANQTAAASDYQAAKTIFDDVIANGVTSNGLKYGLVPYYDNIFRGANDNHQESIWAYQAAANTGSVNNANPEFDLNFPYNTGPNGPGNCCGFFQPTFTFVNSFRTSNGLPLLDGSFNAPANRVANDLNIESNQAFTPDSGPLDPRLDHTTGRRGLPYLDWQDHPGKSWIRKQDYAGPYAPKKYVYTRSEQGSFQDNSSWTPGYTGINFMIIRFADVLLMSAEADIEVGSLETARAKVNLVRTRAINSPLLRSNGTPAANYVISTYTAAWTDPNTARAAVRFERKLELGMEGHRFYDLVRWGTVNAEMAAYFALDGSLLIDKLGGASFTDKHKVLPIPQSQIDLLGPDVLIQNPGF
jgi:hypothetical protein